MSSCWTLRAEEWMSGSKARTESSSIPSAAAGADPLSLLFSCKHSQLKIEQLVLSFYVIYLVKIFTVSSCCLAVSSCGWSFLQIYTALVLCAYIIAKYSTCEPPAPPVNFLERASLFFTPHLELCEKSEAFKLLFHARPAVKIVFLPVNLFILQRKF
jgi:hypothetical protein